MKVNRMYSCASINSSCPGVIYHVPLVAVYSLDVNLLILDRKPLLSGAHTIESKGGVPFES